MADIAARRVPLGEVTLNLLSAGEGPPMVFLHGFPEHAGAWRDMLDRFATTHRVHAPDQRGYNLSDRPEGVGAYSGGRLAGDIAALIAHVGGPVVLVGHDWGASVAYAVAMRRPELVSALIVLNGVHPAPYQQALIDDAEQRRAARYIPWLRRPEAEAELSANGHAGMFRMFGGLSDAGWMTEAMRAEYLAAWQRPGALTAMINWYRASPLIVPAPGDDAPANPFTDRAALRIRPRHLLIWGMRDLALRPAATAGLEDWCDDLTRVTVAEADHWIAHTHPDLVERTIRDFLT